MSTMTPPPVDNPDKGPPRKLVVFADGTGNAFSQQESNVWRLYQLLDRTAPDQKAIYIQGVGTSGNTMLARLDGATGFGVPSNVRKLYRFLCWNWREGDEIYMFGFSRGAFTVRALAGLIANQGLMPREIEGRASSTAELDANIMGAWRAYRSNMAPFRWTHILEDIRWTGPTVALTRHVRDLLLGVWRFVQRRPSHRRVLDAVSEHQPERAREKVPIAFLGLFDTVEAYGLPVEELRGVVNWAIWPISFRNRLCNPIVKSIRHALSLDDERTTFHPIRFDQSEDPAVPEGAPPRTREVWFAGMHSDVGGGYADDSLALIPFSWMIDEARKAGLRFDEDAVDRLTRRSSALAPIHNSREGLASFYRYDPRTITHHDKIDGGDPIIHHGVAEKIVFGTGGYAPITLSGTVRVLAPNGELEEIAGFRPQTKVTPITDHPAELAIRELQKKPPNNVLVERVRALVLWRRIAYLLMVVAAVFIALMPVIGPSLEALGFWDDNSSLRLVDAGVDRFVAFIGEWAGAFLPGFLTPWTSALRSYTIPMLICLAVWFSLYRFNGSLHDHIRDSAYEAWVPRKGASSKLPFHVRGLVWLGDTLALGPKWGWVHTLFSRWIAPGAFALTLVLAAGVALSRSTVGVLTRSGYFCENAERGQKVAGKEDQKNAQEEKATPETLRPGDRHQTTGFSPKQICFSPGVVLVKGQAYTLWIEPDSPFVDRTIVTPPGGFLSDSLRLLAFQKALRRSKEAAWLQPIAQIGVRADAVFPLEPADGQRPTEQKAFPDTPPDLKWYQSWDALKGTDQIAFETYRKDMAQQQKADSTYRFMARFTAPEDGELFLYVNDVLPALPFLGYMKAFYGNNDGKALVTIQRDPLPSDPPQ